MAASRGNTRSITVSFPLDLAEQAEQLARTESRTMSELFREAFRTYRAEQVRKRLELGRVYGRKRNPAGYSEDDVEGLVHKARTALASQKRRTR